MSKLFIILVSSVLFSCGKKYSCSCYTNVNFNSGSSVFSSAKSSPINEKTTKKQAQAICDREAANLDETYKNIFTNNGSSKAFASSKTNCTVQ
ncbi:MAG TPA: hypothetical protein PLU73_04285 [Bacteroidia bacterium]|jgi:hypothetical protein|nr:hypothetical protein [Bacteroidia bacterium]